MIENYFIEYPDRIYADGTDITAVIKLAVSGANGLMSIFSIGLDIFITTVFTFIISLTLRFAIIRRTDAVEKEEVKFAEWAIIISSAAAPVIGILLTDINMAGYALMLSWQQPLFMFTVYFHALKNRADQCSGQTDNIQQEAR